MPDSLSGTESQNLTSATYTHTPPTQILKRINLFLYPFLFLLLLTGFLLWKNIELNQELENSAMTPNQGKQVDQKNTEDVAQPTTSEQMKSFDKQIGLPLEFSFPSTYMVAGTDQEGTLNIFIDKEPILFLEGDVLPGIIQVRYTRVGSNTTINYEQAINNTSAGLLPESLEKTELKSVKGELVKGIIAPGYMEGKISITAVISTKNNPVIFSYISDTNKDPNGITEKDFYKIIESIHVL